MHTRFQGQRGDDVGFSADERLCSGFNGVPVEVFPGEIQEHRPVTGLGLSQGGEEPFLRALRQRLGDQAEAFVAAAFDDRGDQQAVEQVQVRTLA